MKHCNIRIKLSTKNRCKDLSSPDNSTKNIQKATAESLLHKVTPVKSHSPARFASIASGRGHALSFMFTRLLELGPHQSYRKNIERYFFKLLLLMLLNVTYSQHCSYQPSTMTSFYGIVGRQANFSFESLTPSWNGNLFTWKFEGSTLAAFEYKFRSYVVDELPSTRVTANSTYVSNTRSLHNLTIKSLLASDNGKQLIFYREGCTWNTDKAEPVNLFVSCCDHYVFGSNAVPVTNGQSVNCNDQVVFDCNETSYQPKNFTAVCQANSTWNITKHTCVSYCDPLVFGLHASTTKSNIKYRDNVVFSCNETIFEPKSFNAECQAHATWNIMKTPCLPISTHFATTIIWGIVVVCLIVLFSSFVVKFYVKSQIASYFKHSLIIIASNQIGGDLGENSPLKED